MTLNGNGVRDIVRVLGVSSTTIIDGLKKSAGLTAGEQKAASDPRTSAHGCHPVEGGVEIDEIVLGWDTPPCSDGVTIESIDRPMTQWTTDTSIEHSYIPTHIVMFEHPNIQ